MARTQIIVVAFIKKGSTYLLTKRNDPGRFVHETWQVPGGGLEFGETIKQCLHREVKEETGVEVKILKLIPFFHEKFVKKENWHGIAIGFLCKLKNPNATIKLNHEATEYAWFTRKEARRLRLHHGTENFLKKI